MIPTLVMLVGLPCSGKSTFVQPYTKSPHVEVFSSDTLREELFGNVDHQTDNDLLFKELHKRIKNCLKSGKSAIYDATNINYKRRMAFLAELKNIPCHKECVLMATPYEVCLERNKTRDRKVPEYVIERMYKNFDIPYYYEGWDNIKIKYSEGAESSFGWSRDWAESMRTFDQENPHHTLSLGDHCIATHKALDQLCKDAPEPLTYKVSFDLIHATLLHDCGKPSCKTFTNSKGEMTEVAHYYNHERTGSYNSLFYNTYDDNLYRAALIRWHMQPYYWEKDNNEKLHNKYRKLWGEDLYKEIMLLHTCDRAAH